MLASDLARALLWAYVFRPARSVRGAVRDAKTVAAKLFFILVAPIVFVASLLRCEEESPFTTLHDAPACTCFEKRRVASQFVQFGRHFSFQDLAGEPFIVLNVPKTPREDDLNARDIKRVQEEFEAQGEFATVVIFVTNQFKKKGPKSSASGMKPKAFEYAAGRGVGLVIIEAVDDLNNSPVHLFLRMASEQPWPIEGDFVKFLVGADGSTVRRFGTSVLLSEVVAELRDSVVLRHDFSHAARPALEASSRSGSSLPFSGDASGASMPALAAAGGADAHPSGAVRVVGAGRRRRLALAAWARSPPLVALAVASATLAAFLQPAAAASGRADGPRRSQIDGVLLACALHLTADSLLRAYAGGLLRGADGDGALAGARAGSREAFGLAPPLLRVLLELFCSWNLCLDISFLAGDWADRRTRYGALYAIRAARVARVLLLWLHVQAWRRRSHAAAQRAPRRFPTARALSRFVRDAAVIQGAVVLVVACALASPFIISPPPATDLASAAAEHLSSVLFPSSPLDPPPPPNATLPLPLEAIADAFCDDVDELSTGVAPASVASALTGRVIPCPEFLASPSAARAVLVSRPLPGAPALLQFDITPLRASEAASTARLSLFSLGCFLALTLGLSESLARLLVRPFDRASSALSAASSEAYAALRHLGAFAGAASSSEGLSPDATERTLQQLSRIALCLRGLALAGNEGYLVERVLGPDAAFADQATRQWLLGQAGFEATAAPAPSGLGLPGGAAGGLAGKGGAGAVGLQFLGGPTGSSSQSSGLALALAAGARARTSSHLGQGGAFGAASIETSARTLADATAAAAAAAGGAASGSGFPSASSNGAERFRAITWRDNGPGRNAAAARAAAAPSAPCPGGDSPAGSTALSASAGTPSRFGAGPIPGLFPSQASAGAGTAFAGACGSVSSPDAEAAAHHQPQQQGGRRMSIDMLLRRRSVGLPNGPPPADPAAAKALDDISVHASGAASARSVSRTGSSVGSLLGRLAGGRPRASVERAEPTASSVVVAAAAAASAADRVASLVDAERPWLGPCPAKDSGELDSWDLDVFNYGPLDLCRLAFAIFEASGAVAHGFCSEAVLWAFVVECSNLYQHNPFHCWRHTVDVLQTTFHMVRAIERRGLLSPLEQFALLVAALAHDADHPGVTNAFLVATNEPLAVLYNDTAVLESHHAATLFRTLQTKPQANVFQRCDPETFKGVRKLVVEAIMHTDMARHFKMVSDMEVYAEVHRGAVTLAARGDAEAVERLAASAADRQFVANLLLHCADVSNPAKPKRLQDRWAECVTAEFWEQGDREAALGLPVSPGFDRRTTSLAMSQINFAEFIVAPLFVALVGMFPEMRHALLHVRLNYGQFVDAELAARGGSEAERAPLQKRRAALEKKLAQAASQAQRRLAPRDGRFGSGAGGAWARGGGDDVRETDDPDGALPEAAGTLRAVPGGDEALAQRAMSVRDAHRAVSVRDAQRAASVRDAQRAASVRDGPRPARLSSSAVGPAGAGPDAAPAKRPSFVQGLLRFGSSSSKQDLRGA